MATIAQSGNFFEITGIAADLSTEDIFKSSEERKVKRLEFIPGAAGDKCVVRNKDGAMVTTLLDNDRIYFHQGGQYIAPTITFADCVLNAGHVLLIELA